jgi:hypothetical protein
MSKPTEVVKTISAQPTIQNVYICGGFFVILGSKEDQFSRVAVNIVDVVKLFAHESLDRKKRGTI